MIDRTRTRLFLFAFLAWFCASFAATTIAEILDTSVDHPVYTLVDEQDGAAEPCLAAPDPVSDGIDRPFILSVRPAACTGQAVQAATADIRRPFAVRFAWQGRAPPAA